MSEEERSELNTVADQTENEGLPIKADPEQQETETHNADFPKKLEEIKNIMIGVDQRLEDLSREQRNKIAQLQWSALEEYKSRPKANLKPLKFWQNSLFARTYFVDKDLDETFNNVVKQSSGLISDLNSLLGIIPGRGEGDFEFNNGLVEVITPSPPYELRSKNALSNRGEFLMLPNANVSSKVVKEAFTDLIKAKIDFDSRFINYHTVLSKNSFTEDFHHLYEICSSTNLLGQSLSIKNRKIRMNKTKPRRKRLANDNIAVKTSKRQTRRSTRLGGENDSTEVQVIQCTS